MKKKILAMMLMMLMMTSVFTGCKNNTGTTDNATGNTTSSKDTTSSAEGKNSSETGSTPDISYLSGTQLFKEGIQSYQYGSGELAKYSEPLHLTFGRPIDLNASEFIAMAEAGEPVENNRWIQYFKEALNIDCEYMLTNSATGDYKQQLLLAMSSGELPDVFLVYDLSMLNQLAEAGAIWDLTEVYQANANETLVNHLEVEGTEIYGTGMVDGKLYGIPQKMPSTNAYNHLWIRRDWLEQLNLEVPKTMDEVKTVTQAFKDSFVDNVGLMFSDSYLYEYQGIFWAYGGQQNSSRDQWIELDDGQLGFAEVQPEMKDGLKWIRDMYVSDLINPEFATEDTWSALSNYVATNRCGIFYGPHWYGFSLQSYEASMDPSADWIEIGLPQGDPSYEIKVPANNVTDGWICVNSDCENPEAVIQMLNAYVEKLFGEKNEFGEYFASDLNSMMWKASPIWTLSATVDLDPCVAMTEAWNADTKTMDETKLSGAGLTYWNYIKSGQSAYDYMFGPEDSCFNFVQKTYPDIMLWNKNLGAPTETQVDRWSSMQELIDTYYLKMILGELDIDTGFEEMIQEWNELGGTKVTQEINDRYKAMQ